MKVHVNVLYGAVILLLGLQILSFVSFSSQMSKLISEKDELEEDFSLMKQENQYNINEIVKIIAQQKSDIVGEIEILKNTQQDFSEIIEASIRKVVSVKTGESIGAGFLIDKQGYVVANLHLLNGMENVEVKTFEGQSYDAEIIGEDSQADLVLLKISGNFDSFELDDSEKIQVGEKVIAIGNPLGLSFTVTEGIVSAVERRGPNGLEVYVQTDVTLNPGNSGGPLINQEGKVIGINNFKIGEAESLGFALESNVIRERINLIANEVLIE